MSVKLYSDDFTCIGILIKKDINEIVQVTPIPRLVRMGSDEAHRLHLHNAITISIDRDLLNVEREKFPISITTSLNTAYTFKVVAINNFEFISDGNIKYLSSYLNQFSYEIYNQKIEDESTDKFLETLNEALEYLNIIEKLKYKTDLDIDMFNDVADYIELVKFIRENNHSMNKIISVLKYYSNEYETTLDLGDFLDIYKLGMQHKKEK